MPGKQKKSFKFRLPEIVLLVLVFFSGTMLAFSSGSFVVSFKSVGFTVLSTVEKQVHAVSKGVSDTFGAVKELARLRKDYEELAARLENYEQMQRSNAEIRKENARLKEQLDFSTSLEEKNYPARIISRDADNLTAYLTIDKGSAAGIRKNMPVIAFQNGSSGLVGKVVQVGLYTSIVMPVYSTDCSVSARIQNTRDLGLVTGNGTHDRPLSMQYIRERILNELHYGDIVVTSGENSNYMRDIPLGTISKITIQSYNSSLDIEIMPAIDFSRLENVVVVNLREINDLRNEAQ
ncbi:MAG: rod shape-determining protein MreC [Treponemataceae bacterium]|nr:rod shape-determining protein MreC [Treponemataceae bacterium]